MSSGGRQPSETIAIDQKIPRWTNAHRSPTPVQNVRLFYNRMRLVRVGAAITLPVFSRVSNSSNTPIVYTFRSLE